MKEISTPEATPEQLVQMLDAQMAISRAKRGMANRNRATLLVGGVLFIFIAAGLALVVLAQMVSDMPHGERAPTAQAEMSNPGKF
jgi:hypothetical protein